MTYWSLKFYKRWKCGKQKQTHTKIPFSVIRLLEHYVIINLTYPFRGWNLISTYIAVDRDVADLETAGVCSVLLAGNVRRADVVFGDRENTDWRIAILYVDTVFTLPFSESLFNAVFDLEHECSLLVNDKLLRWVRFHIFR